MFCNKYKVFVLCLLVVCLDVTCAEKPCCNYRGTLTRLAVSSDNNEWFDAEESEDNAKIIVKQEIGDTLPIELQMYYKTEKEEEFHRFTAVAFCFGLANMPDDYYNSIITFVILKKAILSGMQCPITEGSYVLQNIFHIEFSWGGEVPSCITPITIIERIAHRETNHTLFTATYELFVDNALDCRLLGENNCNWWTFFINHLKIYNFEEWKSYAMDNECWLWLRHLNEAYEMFVKTPLRMIYNYIRNKEKNHSIFS